MVSQTLKRRLRYNLEPVSPALNVKGEDAVLIPAHLQQIGADGHAEILKIGLGERIGGEHFHHRAQPPAS